MTIYNVAHVYDREGEFGDAEYTERLVATFESREDAETFVAKYSKPYIYAKPYDELWCNQFVIIEVEIISHSEFNLDKTPEEYGVWIPERRI